MQITKRVFLIGGFPYPYRRSIYRLKLKNIYAVAGKDALVLVDTGEDEDQLKIAQENIVYWGLSELSISHVLITHSHYAHCANAHVLRKSGAKIVAGPGDAEGIESGDDRTINYAYTHKNKFIPCKVDIRVKDGDTVHAAGLDFEVIHVPGHSSGSLIFRLKMDDKIILFTGDTVKADNYCSQAKLGWSGGTDFDPTKYMESIKRISKLSADILLPGDSQPCLREAWQLLQDSYTQAKMKLLNQPADT
jgi:hydroxyacylglutathione hydrolase